MALKMTEWLRRMLGADPEAKKSQSLLADEAWDPSSEIYVRELAFWGCVNLVGAALSRCKFRTFLENREIKGEEYYLWNFEPNKNQNSNQFFHKLMAKLFSENETLVVESAGQLLVADSYQIEEYAVQENVFSQVTVGDFTFSRAFYQQDVLFLKLGEKDMRCVIYGMASAYQRMIAYGMKSYQRSRGRKGTLTMDTAPGGTREEREAFLKEQQRTFQSFAEAESAALTLYNGMEYKDLESRTYSNEGTRDIRAMIDDVFYFTAKAFGIHPVLISGTVEGTAEAEQQFLTYPLGNLINLLETEINRKRYGQRSIQQGSFLKIDAMAIRNIDILNFPTSMERMISSGVYSVNEMRTVLGEPLINESWAWKHFITKNYSELQEIIDVEKGGEKS